MTKNANIPTIIARTRCWVEKAVIELNLCPFARAPHEADQVRYVVSQATRPKTLLDDLHQELEYLRATDAAVVETTVLIHPYVLNDFFTYNDFLDDVDEHLLSGGYEGEFQVASLHPHYQFSGTHIDDVENYTNRSPYPILHVLREEGLEHAISGYLRPEKIPERNIGVMKREGVEKMRAILDECMKIEVDNA